MSQFQSSFKDCESPLAAEAVLVLCFRGRKYDDQFSHASVCSFRCCRFSPSPGHRKASYSSPTRYISGVFSPSRYRANISANTSNMSSPARFTSHRSPASRASDGSMSVMDRSRVSEMSMSTSFAEGSEEAVYRPEEPPEKSVKSTASLKRLIAMTTADWKYGVGAMLVSIAAGCLGPTNAWLLGNVLSDYYNSDQNYMRRHIKEFSLFFVVLGGASLVIHTLQHFSLGVVGEHLVKGIREKLFSSKYQPQISI